MLSTGHTPPFVLSAGDGRSGLGDDAELARAVGDEAVADVADRPDQRLVLAAELGPQPPDVDVHGAGTAEVVVAPDLLEQLGPAEDPAGVLGEELQQLELLVGEVEQPGRGPGRSRSPRR